VQGDDSFSFMHPPDLIYYLENYFTKQRTGATLFMGTYFNNECITGRREVLNGK